VIIYFITTFHNSTPLIANVEYFASIVSEAE
jgi:dynein heavy chain, axonemal